jgi:hypothetical protein
VGSVTSIYPDRADVPPFWIARQTDLEGPDFVPGQVGLPIVNVTHRSWTMVGTMATVDRGVVDPRGLVTASGGWSLDWWVGADDRWHTPATDHGVRQHLIGDSPVVETVMRIPGGDAVERVYAIHAPGDSPFGQAFIVVEVENQSAVPFALALAVVPANPVGEVAVTSIALDGTTLMVNGDPAVIMAKAPSRAAATAGDVAGVVFGGSAPASFADLEAPDGNGQAALIFPLPHTAVLRVVLPLGPRPAVDGGRGRSRRSPGGSRPTYPSAVPTAEQVAKGWEVQTRRGLGLTVPDPAMQSSVEAGRRMLVLAHGGEDLAAWPDRSLDWVDAVSVLGALDRYGFHEEVGQILATIPERQALDGSLREAHGRADANGAALFALGDHWRITRDDALIEELVGPIAKAAHWIAKRGSRRRGAGRMTASDLEWSVRGLRLVADALDAVGQPEVAADARRFAAEAATELTGIRSEAATGTAVETAGFAVVDPEAHAGLSPRRTLAQATAELALGDPTSLDRWAWVRSVESPTHVWPDVVHPRTGDGSRGDGHHPATGADVLVFVRDLLVRDTGSGLALCSVLPSTWLGQGFEVHDAPTAWGRLSFAVRWHGERPALLWDLDPHPGPAAVITAPGIDPSWSTTEPRGDALLAAPILAAPAQPPPTTQPPPTQPPPTHIDPGASFS